MPIPPPPPAGNYILDELNWLTSEQETRINSTIRGLDRDGVVEIAVVTLDDCGSNRLAFRKSLFDTWGIGHADDNVGLLILVCWYGGDPSRRSVEQLYGRGLNGALKSGVTGEIAQKRFVPAFEAGKPGNGLVRMIRRYNDILRYAASCQSSDPLVRFISDMDDGTKLTGGCFSRLPCSWSAIESFPPRSVNGSGIGLAPAGMIGETAGDSAAENRMAAVAVPRAFSAVLHERQTPVFGLLQVSLWSAEFPVNGCLHPGLMGAKGDPIACLSAGSIAA